MQPTPCVDAQLGSHVLLSFMLIQVILGLEYDEKIDIWSLGCILAEMFTGDVLFKNDSEQILLMKIVSTIGKADLHGLFNMIMTAD